MFSEDVRDCTPTDTIEVTETTEDRLRKTVWHRRTSATAFKSIVLRKISAQQSNHFHQSSLVSAKLCHYLKPEALAFMPEDTGDLPEEVIKTYLVTIVVLATKTSLTYHQQRCTTCYLPLNVVIRSRLRYSFSLTLFPSLSALFNSRHSNDSLEWYEPPALGTSN